MGTANAQQHQITMAATFAVLGMMCLGFIDNFVPMIAEDIGLWQFHASRAALVVVGLVVLAKVFGWKLAPNRPWAVAVRSLLASLAMVLYFGSVASLPIAEVAAGLFTSPIFVLLIGWACLGHSVGPVRILAVAIGFLGVLLVLKPDTTHLSVLTVLPILAGFFWGCAGLATRALCSDESAPTLLAGFFLCLGLIGVLGLIWFAVEGQETLPEINGFFGTGWQAFTPRAAGLVVAQAVLSGIGVGFLIRAYQMAEASHVTVFEYAFLVSAGGWAYVLFGELPDNLAIVGILLIACAGILIVLRGETSEPLRVPTIGDGQ